MQRRLFHRCVHLWEKTSACSIPRFTNGVENRYRSIEESHRESAHTWIQSLLNEIYSNIVKYSPELSKHAKRIQIMTEQIRAWEQRKIKLGEYTEKLCSMMDWKTV